MERKVLAILSIVFGGLGLLLSWIPIINNFAFVLGILSLILGVIALIFNRKNKKILSIIGTSLSVVTIVVVVATQGMYAHAINKATTSYNKDVKKIESSSSSSTPKNESESKEDSSNSKKVFKIGETASVNGIEYTVNKVSASNGDGELNKPNDGKQYFFVDITIKNNSKKDYSYNPLDFQLSNDGNKTDSESVSDDFVKNQFHFGTLSPDATYTATWVGQSGLNGSLSFTYKGTFSETSDFEFQLR
ncbi:DUF4352 domain-containing protein [Leuconostoc citreum]|uniref:DUF4352 domain-containing protein n=1 Tax=Leuconostoc citreum TaxID=33964 RepID=UPI0002466467|nr:DUF4190 domain-containing protein [Leuconostoc citreum]MBU7449994.1 DUF4352 domain-containing protein [Leuconostoc citreum]CCF24388.1 Putative uncharacterized protein [Leuconostoc citreum LBAE C10]